MPGFRTDLVAALIRTLPKEQRRLFVPAAETVEAIAPHLDPADGPLPMVLAHHLGRRAGTVIDPDQLDLGAVPGHLRPTFRIVNADYELLAEGKDLSTLRNQLHRQVIATISSAVADQHDLERAGLTRWDFESLPRMVETRQVRAYPALVDEGESVAIRLLPSPDEQADAMWLGVRRLLRLNLGGPVRQLDEALPMATKLSLVNGHVQSKAEWYNDAIDAAIDTVIADAGGPAWSRADFDALLDESRSRLPELLTTAAEAIEHLAATLDDIHTKLDRLTSSLVSKAPGTRSADTPSYELSLDDVRAHLGRLAYPGFLAGVGLHRLDDIGRYLAAIDRRLDGLVKSPRRDVEALAICRRLDNELAEVLSTRGMSEAAEEVVWMLEELRVSLFAQSLGTRGKISEKRARRAINQLR